MAYAAKQGRRPPEYASKSSHGYIVVDPTVEALLKNCHFPKSAQEVTLTDYENVKVNDGQDNPIENIIAVDGSFRETDVRSEFPSSTLTFFQFGILFFRRMDLEELETQPFIDPGDIAKLNNIQRVKLAFPTKNIIYKDEKTLTHSVRRALYEFFTTQPSGDTLIETLRWLLYEEYSTGVETWQLANCPQCGRSNVDLNRGEMSDDFTFNCPHCKDQIFLTDVFRLHEAIDDELGAGGVISYTMNLIEHLLVLHVIRLILKTKPDVLKETLFIKDGPLAFFGQTANLYKPTRKLLTFLDGNNDIYMVGLEKSGAFVEHADQISEKIPPNTALILNNEYIYKYIIPGHGDDESPYGKTTYFGNKVIFKTSEGQVYVASIPTLRALVAPKKEIFLNLETVLLNVKLLRCDMYDSALIPVALANKLISLSDHPSATILEKFAREHIKK